MTRRPRSDRPPRLPDRPPPAPRARRPPAAPSATRRLVQAGVAGPHPSLGRDEVWAAARHLAAEPRRTDDPPVTPQEVRDALVEVAGPQDGPRAAIDPARALHAARRAGGVLADVARDGGRVACATAAPASLLAFHSAAAAAARAVGATVVTTRAAGPYLPGRSLWWVADVAVATDGHNLIEEHRAEAADEWLFTVGRPDLVVADGVFARVAVTAGLRTVAVADLDAPGAALAAHRGRPVVVVPAAAGRPPDGYTPLLDALRAGLDAAPAPAPGRRAAPGAPGGDGSRQPPHLATETPGPYAAPGSGGEEG